MPIAENDLDAPRMIVAPGGYQWWCLEAHDPVSDIRVVAIVFDGNPFDPRYLRRYAWYRRSPTRVVPPVPLEYPGVFLRVYKRDVAVGGGVWKAAPGGCRVTASGVHVGGDGFTRDPRGTMRLTIQDAVDLTFRPNRLSVPQLHQIAGGVSVGDAHGWIVSNPMCAVQGEMRIRDRVTRFDGAGYQDHRYGAEPLSLAVRRCFWACAWLDDRARVVSEVVGTREDSHGLHLVDSADPGSAVWGGRTRLRIPYPTMVDFGPALRLDEPHVLESTPLLVQLRYRARIGDVTTAALAHVIKPRRAGWPLVGCVLERRFHRARRS